MDSTERDELAEAVLGASRSLLAIAIRSVSDGPAPVTVVQHRVLVLLETHGSLSVNALAEELAVDQSNASRHCTRLVGLGLAARTRASHDGRAVDIRLTRAGRRQVATVRSSRRREILRILAGLSDAEARQLASAFRTFERAASLDERTPVI